MKTLTPEELEKSKARVQATDEYENPTLNRTIDLQYVFEVNKKHAFPIHKSLTRAFIKSRTTHYGFGF